MKHMTKTCLKGAALAMLTTAIPGMALSQSLPAPGQDEDGWRKTLGLYLFAPLRASGTSTIAGSSVDFDMDLGDILELLDFALSGRFEAWNGDMGVIFDANYVGLEADGALPGPAATPFNVQIRQKWLGLYGAYRIADATYGANNQRYTIDLQGGVRYNNLKQELTLGAAPTLGGDESWWEPVVGARGMWRINPKWTTIASLELGGFGAGGNDLQLGANIGFDYQPWKNTALTFGYRYYKMDFSTTQSTGTFAYDTDQHGPYIGVKFFF